MNGTDLAPEDESHASGLDGDAMPEPEGHNSEILSEGKTTNPPLEPEHRQRWVRQYSILPGGIILFEDNSPVLMPQLDEPIPFEIIMPLLKKTDDLPCL